MGLSVMADLPDMDQAMRLANISNQMQTLTHNQWMGEQNLNGLGLGDMSPTSNEISNGINQGVNAFTQIYGTIQASKIAKAQAKAAARGGHPAASAMPPAHQDAHATGGGEESSDIGKYLIYGGLAIAGIVVLMMVLKKKKKED